MFANDHELFFFSRYHMERDGKECKLVIKECRPDDECEYACGVEDKRTRARLFVEGISFSQPVPVIFIA